MKKALLFVPIVLSLAVLGAHYLRYGNPVGVGGAALLTGLLFLRRAWVARLVQTSLVLGALQWCWTTWTLVQFRAAMDAPFVRMAVILTAVACVALCSALLFETTTLKNIYGTGRADAGR